MIIFEAVRVMIMFALAFVVALLITPFVVHFLLEKYALKKKNIKEEPATDKQIAFMQKLGIKFPKEITKEEAKHLISEHQDKKKGAENNDY